MRIKQRRRIERDVNVGRLAYCVRMPLLPLPLSDEEITDQPSDFSGELQNRPGDSTDFQLLELGQDEMRSANAYVLAQPRRSELNNWYAKLTDPLLTAAEEVGLAQQIELGLVAQHSLDCAREAMSTIDNETREDLRSLVQDGRLAYARFVRSNLRLVVSIAKRFTSAPLELEDVLQEGNIGLLRAVEKFDWTKGNKFSTYATWWIRQAISRAIADQGRLIRIPVHAVDEIARIRATRKEMTDPITGDPSDQEVADHLDVDVSRLRQLEGYARDPVSLHVPVWTSEGPAELGEVLLDPWDLPLEENIEREEVIESVRAVVDALSVRERQIIRRRYGLDGLEPGTLDAIGAEFHLTRERIRQLEVKTVKELRQNPTLRALTAGDYDDLTPLESHSTHSRPAAGLRRTTPEASKLQLSREERGFVPQADQTAGSPQVAPAVPVEIVAGISAADVDAKKMLAIVAAFAADPNLGRVAEATKTARSSVIDVLADATGADPIRIAADPRGISVPRRILRRLRGLLDDAALSETEIESAAETKARADSIAMTIAGEQQTHDFPTYFRSDGTPSVDPSVERTSLSPNLPPESPERTNMYKATLEDGTEVTLRRDGTWGFPTADAATTTFRRTRWGATAEEIEASEEGKPKKGHDGSLTFKGKIAHLETKIRYELLNDALTRARYEITEEISSTNKYLGEFDSFKDLLTKKYGAPVEDTNRWIDDSYKDEPNEWGDAVSRGDLELRAVWQSPDTRVTAELNGRNYEISMTITYDAVQYEHLARAAREAEILADL